MVNRPVVAACQTDTSVTHCSPVKPPGLDEWETDPAHLHHTTFSTPCIQLSSVAPAHPVCKIRKSTLRTFDHNQLTCSFSTFTERTPSQARQKTAVKAPACGATERRPISSVLNFTGHSASMVRIVVAISVQTQKVRSFIIRILPTLGRHISTQLTFCLRVFLPLTDRPKGKKKKQTSISDNSSVVSTFHKIMANTDVRITKEYKT